MSYKKLISLAFVGLVAGCSTNPVTSTTDKPLETPFAISKSASVQREVIPSTDVRITEQAGSINQFAVKMYSQLIKDSGNVFFSPYSITTALGMTDAGAAGSTDEEIRKALQVTLTGDDFHVAINGMDQSLKAHSDATENLELNVINSIWAQNGFPLRVTFLDQLSRHYDAGINLLDFFTDPDPSRIIINTWVSDQTNQRIKDLIPDGVICKETKLVLTNAIYFKADWLLKFDAQKTDNQKFALLNGDSIPVPMMKHTGKDNESIKLLYRKLSNFRILELPYRGERVVMDFILPDSGIFNTFESGMTTEMINTSFKNLDSVALTSVRIPKFEFSTPSISLVEAFNELGMVVPFSDGANFSGISQSSLKIGNIIHKAFIKVDESGTETIPSQK
jgi:serpin B